MLPTRHRRWFFVPGCLRLPAWGWAWGLLCVVYLLFFSHYGGWVWIFVEGLVAWLCLRSLLGSVLRNFFRGSSHGGCDSSPGTVAGRPSSCLCWVHGVFFGVVLLALLGYYKMRLYTALLHLTY
eukprot:RCo013789